MFNKVLSITVVLLISFCSFSQINNQHNSGNNVEDSLTVAKSNGSFYIAGQFFNATRQIEDLTSAMSFDSLSAEMPISTGGIEVGTTIELSNRFQLGVGLNFFAGGETWRFSDSLSDSSFTYTNKYRQIALPLRLNIVFGKTFKYYGFVGVIPSSILHRRYESSFTTESGAEEVNDVENIQENLNAFQLVGTAGAGVSYQVGPASIFAQFEIRQHLTDTYTGIFLNHRQQLVGGAVGLTFNF